MGDLADLADLAVPVVLMDPVVPTDHLALEVLTA